jgi:integrase
MARFARTAGRVAEGAIREKLTPGVGRKEAAELGNIASYGTARTYSDALKGFVAWRQEQGVPLGDALTWDVKAAAEQYLKVRAESGLSQKTLDKDRQSIECAVGAKFDRVKVDDPAPKESRYISREQAKMVAGAMTPHNALATEVAREAGLRACELATIRPIGEQPPDQRPWEKNRFDGRDNWVRYSVIGKGGLIREVRLEPDLAAKLEATRMAEPQKVMDRDIAREKHYAIGHGQAWSQAFTEAARRALGWSPGAHGCRHGFAQDRMREHQRDHLKGREEAQRAVSQELGHFDPDTTTTYLR